MRPLVVKDNDQQQARKLVKAELQDGVGRLRRWGSKLSLQPGDSKANLSAITSALNKHVGGPAQSSALVGALLGLLEASSKNETELRSELDSILPSLINNKTLHLLAGTSAKFSQSALNNVLPPAVRSENHDLVELLLCFGADVRSLDVYEQTIMIKLGIPFVHTSKLHIKLDRRSFHSLCISAVINEDDFLLHRLFRDTPYADMTEVDSCIIDDRDSLLVTAADGGYYDALQYIASATTSWPLNNAAILRDLTTITESHPQMQIPIMTQVLTLVRTPTCLSNNADLDCIFACCIEQKKYDMLFVMLEAGLRLPAASLKDACHSVHMAVFDQILRHDVEIAGDIWVHLASMPPQSRANSIRQKLVMYMVRNYVEVPAIQVVFLHAIAANQPMLVERLMGLGASVNVDQGQPLRLAISSNDLDVARLLVMSDADRKCLGIGLLATQDVPSDLRGKFTRLIVTQASVLPDQIYVEHVLLNLISSSAIQLDREALSALLETLLRIYVVINDPRQHLLSELSVAAAVDSKLRIQDLAVAQACSSSDNNFSHDHNSITRSRLRNFYGYPRNCVLPKRGISAVPDTCEIRNLERTPVVLLEEHLVECSQTLAENEPWPGGLVDFLLAWMVPIDIGQTQALYQCLMFTMQKKQKTIFRRLLLSITFLKENLMSLFTVLSVSDSGYIDDILEWLYSLQLLEGDRTDVLLAWIVFACGTQDLQCAIYIAKKSRSKLKLSDMLECIEDMLNRGNDLLSAKTLLCSLEVCQNELDLLWMRACSDKTDLRAEKLTMLLQVGYFGSKVETTLYEAVESGADGELVPIILDNWLAPKTEQVAASFNYITRRQTLQSGESDSTTTQYYPVLAKALSIAIRNQRADFCDMLLRHGALLAWTGESVLADAIRYSSQSFTHEDRVLSTLMDIEMSWSNPQVVIDYALVRAIEFQQESIVQNLSKAGASPYSYGHEAWQTAIRSGNSHIIGSLLQSPQALIKFENCSAIIFSKVFTDPELIDNSFAALPKLWEVGLTKPSQYKCILPMLCESDLLTPERYDALLACGVRLDHETFGCLKQVVASGDYLTFEALIKACLDSDIIVECFIFAVDLVLLQKSGALFRNQKAADTISALSLLLTYDIPQQILDSSFLRILKSRTVNEALRPVLCALVRKVSKICIDGEVLGHCYLLNDEKLIDLILDKEPNIATRKAALCWLLMYNAHAVDTVILSKPSEQRQMRIPHKTLFDMITLIFCEANLIRSESVEWFSCAIQVDSTLQDCMSDCCHDLEGLIVSVVSNLEPETQLGAQQLSHLLILLRWLKDYGPYWECRRNSRALPQTYRLDEDAIHNFLLLASERGLLDLVVGLLSLGANPNFQDPTGQSVLCSAVKGEFHDVVEVLIDAGAGVDDGSLHVAICHQNHKITSILLSCGHSPLHESRLFGGVTVLEAFIQNVNEDIGYDSLETCLMTLILWINENMDIMVLIQEIVKVVKVALRQRRAYDLMDGILTCLQVIDERPQRLGEAEISDDTMRYSILSFVDEWKHAQLTKDQRKRLVERLQLLGVEPMLYDEEGDQPVNAINIPERHHKRHAWKTKECAVCGDKGDTEHQIYAALIDACAPLHSWNDDIICSTCLSEYLHTKMFPNDDERVKYKFPSANVPCWAPQCHSTMLDHEDLRNLVDEYTFAEYDLALCQQTLNSGSSFVKCASPNCGGGIWRDETDEEEEKIFFCEVCFENTCVECNDLYEKHNGEPCPVGAEARKSDRIKEEERQSEAALLNEKRCPKCELLYEKKSGCDHITCGKDVYSSAATKGCGFDFCHICFGAWTGGHTRQCAYSN